jgi:hypothetical protein
VVFEQMSLTPSEEEWDVFDSSSDVWDSTEHSVNSSSHPVAVKKRQRKRYVVNLFPRIVKCDIRRFYPRMFANVANSHDPTLMTSFMRTYCLPQFSSVDILQCDDGTSPSFSLTGIGAAISATLLQLETMPDASLIIHNAAIKQFRDTPDQSELSFSVEFVGTKLYDVVCPSDAEDPALQSLANDTNEYLETFRRLPSSTPIELPQALALQSPYQCISMPSLLKRPAAQPFAMRGIATVRMRLDAKHRFCSMESINL